MEKPRLFQYAVILHPTEEDRKKGAKSEVIVPPSEWFLATETEADMRAARAVPEDQVVNADRIEVAVRPF